MKKLRTYIVLIIILITFASGLYYFTHTGKFSSGSFNSLFQKNGKDLKRIEISGQKDQYIILTNNNGNWIVQGEHNANKKAVDALFYVLRHTIKKAPVPGNKYQEALQNLKEKAVHVSLIDKDGGEVEFSLYEKQYKKKIETYLQFTSDTDIFFVECLGVNNGIIQYFAPHMVHWIDNILFHLGADEIQTIKVCYPGSPQKSYKITHLKNKFRLFSMLDTLQSEKYDTLNVQSYFHWFQNISYSDCLINSQLMDSLKRNTEFCSIEIHTTQKEEIKVNTWLIPVAPAALDGNVQFDLDYMYAMTPKKELVYKVSYLQFDPVMMEHEYFTWKKE